MGAPALPAFVSVLRGANRYLDRIFPPSAQDSGQSATSRDRFLCWIIRMFLIWPLKAVVPLSVLFWVLKLCGGPPFLLLRSSSVALTTKRSLRLFLLQCYTLSEIFFYLYQNYRCWALSKEKARPPKIPLDQMMSVGISSRR